MFVQKHFEIFNSTVAEYVELPEEQRWAGGYATISLVDYLEKQCPNFEKLDILWSPSSLKFSRAQLINRAKADSGISNLEVVLDIFAWGGIRRKHACSALQSFIGWEPIISDLRNKKCSSIDAYNQFYVLRKEKKNYWNWAGILYKAYLLLSP